jgi:hypothetical protein
VTGAGKAKASSRKTDVSHGRANGYGNVSGGKRSAGIAVGLSEGIDMMDDDFEKF